MNEYKIFDVETFRKMVSDSGYDKPILFASFNVWPDVVSNSEFAELFNPVSKHEIIMGGLMGELDGIPFYTDGFRYEKDKVLQQHELILLEDNAKSKEILEINDLVALRFELESIPHVRYVRKEEGNPVTTFKPSC